MKFSNFTIENFKGISKMSLDLDSKYQKNFCTLVGLNESGKTTILEAINYFLYKPDNLNALNLESYNIIDKHSLIPLSKIGNFSAPVVVQATLILDEIDKKLIENEFKKNNINIQNISSEVTYIQEYHFENSKYIPDKFKSLWNFNVTGKVGKKRVAKALENKDALIANKIITDRIPSIFYFPNFLFQFKEKIYINLEKNKANELDNFYSKIIEDALASVDKSLNLDRHVISRIAGDNISEIDSLNQILRKLQNKISTVVFNQWDEMFKNDSKNNKIIIKSGSDDKGVFLSLKILVGENEYNISQRSIGFRWFFAYCLITHFRAGAGKNTLFLFDEPASNLHPAAQVKLLKSFESLSNVVYTTHSPYMINAQWLDQAYVVTNSAQDKENNLIFDEKDTDIKIEKYKHFSMQSKTQVTYYQPILDALHYKPSELSYRPNTIILEGKTDFYAFEYLKNQLKEFNPLDYTKYESLKFLPGTSASNLELLISMYLSWGWDFLILLDSDKEGLRQREIYTEKFGELVTKKIYTYQDIKLVWKNFAIEKVFSNTFKSQALSLNSYSKKELHNTININLISNKNFKLDSETKDNLINIFDFLKSKIHYA
jgi:predicted ATP-dependent endonuclease of OLD family